MKNLFHKTEKHVNHNTKAGAKPKKGFRFLRSDCPVHDPLCWAWLLRPTLPATLSRWSTTFLISSLV